MRIQLIEALNKELQTRVWFFFVRYCGLKANCCCFQVVEMSIDRDKLNNALFLAEDKAGRAQMSSDSFQRQIVELIQKNDHLTKKVREFNDLADEAQCQSEVCFFLVCSHSLS